MGTQYLYFFSIFSCWGGFRVRTYGRLDVPESISVSRDSTMAKIGSQAKCSSWWNSLSWKGEVGRLPACALDSYACEETIGIEFLVVDCGLSGLRTEGLPSHSKPLCSLYGHLTQLFYAINLWLKSRSFNRQERTLGKLPIFIFWNYWLSLT